MIVILGGGLAGLACSYHLGHEYCLILEKAPMPFGHIASETIDGFTWDKGPHVSFTKSEYVRDLFAKSVDQRFDEYPVVVGNYYQGHWITHPAQTSLYQIPEPLRSECLSSFMATRNAEAPAAAPPANYMEWLIQAFGPVFARHFPAAYTRKYWTVEPADLTTAWLGDRVFYPKVSDVVQGTAGPLPHSNHYISSVRYPISGGFQSFAAGMARGAHLRLNSEVTGIDLAAKAVHLADGSSVTYERLINTLPLPSFIGLCRDVPLDVRNASDELSCSQLLLVNVAARHSSRRPEHWMYVYDESKLSTRINTTERLTVGNAPSGRTGIQVEVYSSRHLPLKDEDKEVSRRVVQELTEMTLLDLFEPGSPQAPSVHTRRCDWANIIFTHPTQPAMERIWRWMENFGLHRESDDTGPLTQWDAKPEENFAGNSLFMAGRFAQWKYYWSDDCILRAKYLAESMRLQAAPAVAR
ncbi:NAD(P)/FAD-dependent oxidoreductase [soil metagenome]